MIDPRIEAVMNAQRNGQIGSGEKEHRGVSSNAVKDILAAADAVDPIRNPTEETVELVVKVLQGFQPRWHETAREILTVLKRGWA